MLRFTQKSPLPLCTTRTYTVQSAFVLDDQTLFSDQLPRHMTVPQVNAQTIKSTSATPNARIITYLDDAVVSDWRNTDTYLEWTDRQFEAGTYRVEVEQASNASNAGAAYELAFVSAAGVQTLKGVIESTRDEWIKLVVVGTVHVDAGQTYSVKMTAVSLGPDGGVGIVRGVNLVCAPPAASSHSNFRSAAPLHGGSNAS